MRFESNWLIRELKKMKKQQKLGKRNTYTPTDASQVCSSVVLSLNREETLGEQNLKTSSNNLDVNQHQQTGGIKSKVFVLNKNGEPLMPCKPAKARHLLKEKKAKVISCKPFTIKLSWDCEHNIQNITLGIDAGSKVIGYSATSKHIELISGELEIRKDVSKKITECSMYRRLRRNKLWYRQPRFLNRTKSKKKGWLAPSIQHKVDTHIRLVGKIKTLLPITRTVVEIAKFNTQKLQNVDIEGVEYQQGQMESYDNLRAFIFCRDNYTCQICKKKEGIFDIHHIIQRKDGGSNRPDNLVCVHNSCHKKFHAGKIKHIFKKPNSYKDTAIMNNIKKYIVDKLGCSYTFGYITKRKRLDLGLEKTHCNDAFVIAEGSNQIRSTVKNMKQPRRNNRCLQKNRKGFKPSIRRKRYKIQPNDIVEFKGVEYVSSGVMSYGKYVTFRKNNNNIKYGKCTDIDSVIYGKGLFTNTEVIC